MAISCFFKGPVFARRSAIRLDYQAVSVVYIGGRLGMRHGRDKRADWWRGLCRSTAFCAAIGSPRSGPASSPRVTSGNACWRRNPERRFSSSGGQFGKLSPYLFLIKKINASQGCQLTLDEV